MPPPTYEAAAYVFAYVWTQPELEDYICDYGNGISLRELRTALGYRARGSMDYVQALIDTAMFLLYSGHQFEPVHAMFMVGFGPRRPDHPVIDDALNWWTEAEQNIQQQAEAAWLAPAVVVPGYEVLGAAGEVPPAAPVPVPEVADDEPVAGPAFDRRPSPTDSELLASSTSSGDSELLASSSSDEDQTDDPRRLSSAKRIRLSASRANSDDDD